MRDAQGGAPFDVWRRSNDGAWIAVLLFIYPDQRL